MRTVLALYLYLPQVQRIPFITCHSPFTFTFPRSRGSPSSLVTHPFLLFPLPTLILASNSASIPCPCTLLPVLLCCTEPIEADLPLQCHTYASPELETAATWERRGEDRRREGGRRKLMMVYQSPLDTLQWISLSVGCASRAI